MGKRVISWYMLALCLILLFPPSAFADSGTYLVTDPSVLNTSNCSTNDHRTWTCVLTLIGMNIGNTIAWNASTPTSGVTFTPSSGRLATVASLVQVTISYLPCVNTTLLFSGQSLGTGVTPAVVTWSCTPQPTPTPRPTPTPLPTPDPTTSTPPPTPTHVYSTPTVTRSPSPVTNVLLPPPTVPPGSSQESSIDTSNGTLTGVLVTSLIIFGTFGILVLRIISIVRAGRRG